MGNDNPNGPAGDYSGSITTAGYYDPFSANAKRVIDDITVPGSVGAYPLKWSRYLNTRGGPWPDTFGYGAAWTHSYCWGLSIYTRDPQYEGPMGRLGYPDGRTADLMSQGGGMYGADIPGRDQVRDVVQDMGNGRYDLLLGDGGKVKFGPVAGITGLAVQAIVDPYGLTTTLTYLSGRLDKITEPGGRYLKINYSPFDWYEIYSGQTYYYYLITSVQAFDGRGNLIETVRYTYTRVHHTNNSPPDYYELTGVNYDDVTSASYTYQPSNGNGANAVWFELVSTCDDVRYNGPMRQIKYEYLTYGDIGGPVSWGQIKQEKNKATNQIVSEVTYPDDGVTGTGAYRRTETRGDGQTRVLQYESQGGTWGNGAELIRYTDFQGHSTNITYSSPSAGVTRKSVTDARGYTTHIDRSGIGVVTQITHPDNSTVKYTYFNTRYLDSTTDERGNVTQHLRDGNNRIIRTNFPDGAYETFIYNGFAQVLTHRLKNGAYEHFTYDSRGLLTAKWNPTWNSTAVPGDPKTIYTYYTSGPWTDRVKTMTLPANVSGYQASETYEYDRNASGFAVAGRGLVTKITHADGTYQAFGYDAYRNKLWEENELRQRTTYTYDAYKRLLSTTNPLNQTTTYSYEGTNGANSSPNLHTTASVRFQTTATGIKTANVYDANFRKTSTTQAHGTGLAATTTFTYDTVGNLTQVLDPLNHATTTTYDSRNRKKTVTDALNQATTFYYDFANNVIRIDRPDGTMETKSYDPLNRVLTDTVPQTATVNLTTWFTYNPSGTIASVKDPKLQVTTFTYDASDQKKKMIYPGGTQSQSWIYDDAHNLASRTTVGGETQSFGYDNRNRKQTMVWSNQAEWAYFAYDAASRLVTAKNGTGTWNTNIISTITRTYNAAGRLSLDQQNVTGLGAKNVNYVYDADGKPTRMYVTGASYDYTFSYDDMGRFETISPFGSFVLFQYSYDAASNEIKRHNEVNLVDQIYPRDALNRMSARDVKKYAYVLSSEAYTYDAMSRLTSVTREDGKEDQFGYYLDGELYWAQYGVSALRTVTYSLDKAGNRVGVNDDGNPTWYTTNGLNQYSAMGGVTVWNGAEHEISAYRAVVYTYLNDEHLIEATNTVNQDNYQLAYDALGRCVKRTLNGAVTYYTYDGEKSVLEYNSAGTLVGRNLYGKGIDEILYRAYGNQSYYFQQDRNGNVTHLTNASGAIIEKYKYDAFGAVTVYDGGGNLRSGGTAYNNRFLFTGREYAATFAFYEYRARAYNPTLGRFMSEDPKGFDAGDYNLFRYVHNDPLDRVDPMGLGDESVNAKMVSMMNLTMHAQTVLPLGSNIPVLAAQLPNGQWVDYRAAGGLTMAQSFEAMGQGLSIGQRLQAAPRESAISRVKDLPIDESGSSTNMRPGDIFVSHYGYPTDKYFDTNSNIARIGNHRNTLNDDSLALTAKVARSYGLKPGDKVYFNGRYLGNYDDTAPQKTQSRIDVYDRYGRHPQNWGGILRSPFTISSRPYFEPWTPLEE